MPTPFESAQLNLQLFDLRREPILREARMWFIRDFNPETFDELMAVDTQWRELETRVTDLRAKTKLKGKPTPEQLEELQQGKEELRTAEEELAAAEAAREAALALVPNPPHESAPDGDSEDDAVELPLPDELHPDPATHRLIAERFAERVFGDGAPFADRR